MIAPFAEQWLFPANAEHFASIPSLEQTLIAAEQKDWLPYPVLHAHAAVAVQLGVTISVEHDGVPGLVEQSDFASRTEKVTPRSAKWWSESDDQRTSSEEEIRNLVSIGRPSF